MSEQPENAETETSELDKMIEQEQAAQPETDNDYNPADDEAAERASENALAEAKQGAEMQAVMACAVISQIVGTIRPDIKISPEQQKQVQEKLAPVLYKYSTGGVPPWLAKYREELELLLVVGLVGVNIHQQVKLAEAKQVQEVAEDGKEPKPEAA